MKEKQTTIMGQEAKMKKLIKETIIVVIIGGIAAGMSAAAKFKRLSPKDDVVVYEKGDIVSFGACGLPYYVGGFFDNHEQMLVRTPEAFRASGIDVQIKHEVLSVDSKLKKVQVKNLETGDFTATLKFEAAITEADLDEITIDNGAKLDMTLSDDGKTVTLNISNVVNGNKYSLKTSKIGVNANSETVFFAKEADWVEIRVQVPEVLPEKMTRVANMIKDRYNVKSVHVKDSKELIKRYGYTFFDLIDTAYQQLYNYSPLTEKQKKYYSDLYFPILNFDLVSLLVNEKDELVGVGVAMPNISKELRKTKGKLFPFGWYHLLKALNSKTYESSDLLLIAVRPDYQNKGINSLIFTDQLPFYQKHQVKYASVTAILETNMKSMSNFLLFDHEVYKRRRAYIKEI